MENKVMSNVELKKALLGITLDTVKYLDENNLKYVIIGGTLLGAVRHKGFIPWDDDIDLAMPRDDYNRLHELVKTKPIGEQYRLVSITAGNSANPFAKVIDTNTKLIDNNNPLHPALWVDIFPIDGMKSLDEKELLLKDKRQKRNAFLMEQAACSYGSGKSILRKIAKIPVVTYARIKGAEYYGRQIDCEAKALSLDDCPYAGITVWGGIQACIEKEKMLTTCELEFEGNMLKAPVGYEEYLEKMYGDYMTPPPEKDRINHNIEVVRI
ncbi:MAG: LicD family protein [Eubacterium sp.]|nr:LicD family protein [Eubacterium sp.]